MNNEITSNRSVVRDESMLYPLSYIPLFATQHLPSPAGLQILKTLAQCDMQSMR